MGIDYRCIPPTDKKAFANTPFANDEGVDYIDYPDPDPIAMGKRLLQYLRQERFEIMVVLPECYPFVTSLVPYLPTDIRCIARMPHNSRGVYHPTKLIASYLNRVIAVAPRLKNDLIRSYHVDAQKVTVISNGVDADLFTTSNAANPHQGIFVGRIEDGQKNVFLLPKILARALTHNSNVRLTVVGSGPDSDRLRARFVAAGLEGHFRMLGRVNPADLPAILGQNGVFILPTRFEGSSNSTLEAMASGCVPLVSRLAGITDNMIQDGHSGCLFTLGDWKRMGDRWSHLMRTETDWNRMRLAAREQILKQFSLDQMAANYARLFQAVVTESDTRLSPSSLSEYHIQVSLASTWRRWIPTPLKKHLRTWAARVGWSP